MTYNVFGVTLNLAQPQLGGSQQRRPRSPTARGKFCFLGEGIGWRNVAHTESATRPIPKLRFLDIVSLQNTVLSG